MMDAFRITDLPLVVDLRTVPLADVLVAIDVHGIHHSVADCWQKTRTAAPHRSTAHILPAASSATPVVDHVQFLDVAVPSTPDLLLCSSCWVTGSRPEIGLVADEIYNVLMTVFAVAEDLSSARSAGIAGTGFFFAIRALTCARTMAVANAVTPEWGADLYRFVTQEVQAAGGTSDQVTSGTRLAWAPGVFSASSLNPESSHSKASLPKASLTLLARSWMPTELGGVEYFLLPSRTGWARLRPPLKVSFLEGEILLTGDDTRAIVETAVALHEPYEGRSLDWALAAARAI